MLGEERSVVNENHGRLYYDGPVFIILKNGCFE